MIVLLIARSFSGSQLADEALRVLAQKEDFSNVQLKRPDLAKTPTQTGGRNETAQRPRAHSMITKL